MSTPAFLKQFAIFQGLADEQLQKLASIAEDRSYSAGDTIFEEGSVGAEFYVVEEGEVEISRNIAGGRRRVLKRLHSPEIFGELSLFDEAPRSARAGVDGDCKVLVFRRDRLFELLDEDKGMAAPLLTGIIREICTRLRQTNEKLNEGVMWGFQLQA